jgi:GT2 family glycosyltransferase
MKSICLAILNYNGRKHLEALLPTACLAAKFYHGFCSVVVLDNCSTDPDVVWMREKFPSLEIVIAPQNDFLFSFNWFARNREEEILIFLNNDLILSADFVQPMVQHFEREAIFAVSATSRDWEDQHFTFGPSQLKHHHGHYYWMPELSRQEAGYTLFASGGFMAVDKEKFLELGGFNHFFWPGYSEDLDLCFRAWRRGWCSIFEPASIVLHREHGTWGGGDGGRASQQMFRATLLFEWSTLPSAAGWWERTGFFFLTILRKLALGELWWFKVFGRTAFYWMRVKGLYPARKVSSQELQAIQNRIAQPLFIPPESYAAKS